MPGTVISPDHTITHPESFLMSAECMVDRKGREGGAVPRGSSNVIVSLLEETGIQTRFISLNCFRHWHGYRFGKSDIYFVCRLEPLTFSISHQEEEIEECLWMPVEEYVSHPNVHVFNRSVVQAVIAGNGIAPIDMEGYGTPETHEFFMPFDTFDQRPYN